MKNLILIISVLLVFTQCKKNPIEPIEIPPSYADSLSRQSFYSITEHNGSLYFIADYDTRIISDVSNTYFLKILKSNIVKYSNNKFEFSQQFDGNIRDILFTNNKMYALIDKEIYKVDNLHSFNKIYTDTTLNSINFFAIDKEDKIYLTGNKGLTIFDGNKAEHYNDLNSILPTNYIEEIQVDTLKNIVWFFLCQNAYPNKFYGLLKIQNNTWEIIDFSEISNLNITYMKNMVIDKEGNLWMIYNNSNILKFDGEKIYDIEIPKVYENQSINVNIIKILNDGRIYFVFSFHDLDNDKWSKGLYTYENSNWLKKVSNFNYREFEIYENQIWTLDLWDEILKYNLE
jgi:sugar lactone lactonase YvrE